MSSPTCEATSWREIFPFDPYDRQEVGIKQALDVLDQNGFYLLEGACGTGKTLIALTAALTEVKDPSTKFQRVLVITSKKQQTRAFEDDIESINAHGDGTYQSLTLVGKADVCPYVEAGAIDEDDIYHRCVQLRNNTDHAMSKASELDMVDRKADAADAFVRDARPDETESRLTVGDMESPYQDTIPETFTDEDYCPFYAQYFFDDYLDRDYIPVAPGMDSRQILEKGAEKGTCPHAAMKRVVDDADVLIGNYKHAFAPKTVENFTGKLFSDETLLVIDEAHEVVEQVRGELSYRVDLRTIQYAINDVNLVIAWLEGRRDGLRSSVARSIAEDQPYDVSDLKSFREFLQTVYRKFAGEVEPVLHQEYGSQLAADSEISAAALTEHTIELEREGGSDVLDAWLEMHAGHDDWVQALTLAYAVAYIRERVKKKADNEVPEGDFAVEEVRELLYRWFLADHEEYYREIQLQPTDRSAPDVLDDSMDSPWLDTFSATIHLHNCLPTDEIAGTLDAFGGGIIMSATLEPLDIYTQVTGIDRLSGGYHPSQTMVTKAARRLKKMRGIIDTDKPTSADDDEDEIGQRDPEERSRLVRQTTFGLDFPPENRASFSVEAPKFTYSNRWPPSENEHLRAQYRETIQSVATTTPGNVLIFTPSYQEAEWAADQLRKTSSVSKEVLADESSSNATTELLKREFVAGPPKVLTTSLRGTLTEGVDFDGDKLHAAVICGVPISSTGTGLAQAIKQAYGSRFGDEYLGFRYAFVAPAVRKARQALGRVIRGDEDVGVRVLADRRYTPAGGSGGVLDQFPDYSRNEFEPIQPGALENRLTRFWDQHY